MAKPMIERDILSRGYVITVGGREWAPANAEAGHIGLFRTRSAAKNFIKRGGMIDVVEISLDEAMAAAGWNEELGYCDENFDRFRAWREREGVHYYARPREDFFPWEAIREAQALGLSKLILEDLS